MIGDDIEIKIIEVKGEQIKVGINAPRHVTVHRKEVYEEIKSANIAATQAANSQDKIDKIKTITSLFKKKTTDNKEESGKDKK